MTNILITIRLSMEEIKTLIGAASVFYEHDRKTLERLLLDHLLKDAQNQKTGLESALVGTGLVVREHFMEMILQIDKDKLDPDAAMLLASIKGKHKIEEQKDD
jgi:hypothetical protein